jgi:glycosyltransferase involved in cell wall biosynthesis
MREATPLVSVLMPVYNGMPYLPLAVESILNQTFTDFEFIIVNDSSADSSIEYLNSLDDARIVLVNLQQNLGVTGALQEGMKRVRGRYVARLDADDIAKPNRLQRQVEYLESNPKVGLLGSSIELIDSSGNLLKHVNLAKDDIEIRWKMLFKNPFFHSTVMFRSDLIINHQLGYTRMYGEDYQLWTELLQFCKGTISCEELIQYRTHQQSWTFTKKLQQQAAFDEINTSILKSYIPEIGNKVDIPRFVFWMRNSKRSEKEQKLFTETYSVLIKTFANKELESNEKIIFVNKQLQRPRDISLWIRLKFFLKSV